MNIVYTRKDYKAHRCSHGEYCGQFVTNAVKDRVIMAFGERRIKTSHDEHFNDIPLRLWDVVGLPTESLRLIAQANGTGGYSLNDCVCVLKEAARQIRQA